MKLWRKWPIFIALMVTGCEQGKPVARENERDMPPEIPEIVQPDLKEKLPKQAELASIIKTAPPVSDNKELRDPKDDQPHSAPAATFPARYQGIWAMDPSDCDASPGLTRIEISENIINSFEEELHLHAIENEKNHKIQVQLTTKSEVSSDSKMITLEIAEEGHTLNYQSPEQAIIYRQCLKK